MVLSLPFILAFIGSAVGLIVGMVIYGDISEAIECPVDGGVGGGGGGPISELFNTLGLETTSSNLIFNFATNGDVGQLMTLSGQQIHSVRLENLDTQGVDIGHITAKVWSGVTVGSPTKVEEARSETIIFDNILAMDNYNATFNFTTTPLLSGSDIVIGFTYYFDDNVFFPTIESDVGGNEGVLVASYGGFNSIGQGCIGCTSYSDMINYQFLGQLITMSDQSPYSLRIENMDATPSSGGKLRAVVYSNVTEGDDISQTTLEATSDFIDFADPQYAFNSDIDVTFNFTTPVYLTGTDNIFVGLELFDVNGFTDTTFIEVLELFSAFGPPHGVNIHMETGGGNWETGTPLDGSSPGFPGNAVDTKMEFIVLSDWETDRLSNNFVDMAMQVMSSQGGGGGQGGIGSEQCQQAKDISWTVIGIIPVALFFFLFAIFSALGTGRQ